ncbi:MAG: hypothetical protein DHS20C15_34220 [Planctomycetota bacterium]|nr:MAG: hypothetical protein DHS20C15_34220 [Planctomycetota bacterium]
MIPLRTLFPALLLLPLACSEGEVHAHMSGDAEAGELAPCCAEPEVDEAEKLAALAPEGLDADESSVTVRDMSMSDLLGDEPALTDPEDGTGLPNLGVLPEFSLIDEAGAEFTRANMLGDVWIVDFIFTRCAGPCPDMSKQFMALQEQGVPARFLSITVDPSYDSPQVLNDYRTNWGAEAERWKLLTGANESIHALGNDGFKMPTNATETPVEGMPRAFHSGNFALVDAAGRVRGYYSYNDKLELAELAKQAGKLAELLPG